MKCKERLTCYETKAIDDQTVRRRYKCAKCNDKIQTEEKIYIKNTDLKENLVKDQSVKRISRHLIEDLKLMDSIDDPLYDSLSDVQLNIEREY